MERTPEPELMDDLEQARAYAEADFEEPNALFVAEFMERFPGWGGTGTILDLGCGPGDIALRLARAWSGCRVDGVDGSGAMLSFARAALADSGLEGRVRFLQGLLPGAVLPERRYDALVSNSLLHHLHEPAVLWDAVRTLGAPGAPVLIMDLMRPPTREQASAIVASYAADEAEVLRTDFFNSLLAAFEVSEVREQLDAAGLQSFDVEPVSDRHLVAWGRLPEA